VEAFIPNKGYLGQMGKAPTLSKKSQKHVGKKWFILT
jgi:hypothetical protein